MIDVAQLREAGKQITAQSLRAIAEKVCAQAPQDGVIRKYAIISTPRVGSTFLANSLHATGLLGWPMEWFNARYVQEFVALLGHMKGEVFLDKIVRGTASSNGVFGVNFHIYQYLDWKKRGLDLLSLGFSKIYWLEREDKIAQAYSYAKSLKTDFWTKEAEVAAGYREGVPVDLGPDEVASALATICKDAVLREMFSIDRAYTYEHLAAGGIKDAVTDILNDFGEAPVPVGPVMARQSRGADSENVEAIRRYFSGGAASSLAVKRV